MPLTEPPLHVPATALTPSRSWAWRPSAAPASIQRARRRTLGLQASLRPGAAGLAAYLPAATAWRAAYSRSACCATRASANAAVRAEDEGLPFWQIATARCWKVRLSGSLFVPSTNQPRRSLVGLDATSAIAPLYAPP